MLPTRRHGYSPVRKPSGRAAAHNPAVAPPHAPGACSRANPHLAAEAAGPRPAPPHNSHTQRPAASDVAHSGRAHTRPVVAQQQAGAAPLHSSRHNPHSSAKHTARRLAHNCAVAGPAAALARREPKPPASTRPAQAHPAPPNNTDTQPSAARDVAHSRRAHARRVVARSTTHAAPLHSSRRKHNVIPAVPSNSPANKPAVAAPHARRARAPSHTTNSTGPARPHPATTNTHTHGPAARDIARPGRAHARRVVAHSTAQAAPLHISRNKGSKRTIHPVHKATNNGAVCNPASAGCSRVLHAHLCAAIPAPKQRSNDSQAAASRAAGISGRH